MSHWVEQYIGIPYGKGGTTTDFFDCWGLVRYIQREHFNLDLPIIDVDSDNMRQVIKSFKSNDELHNWYSVDKPKNGTAVLLSQAQNSSHVGVWIDVDGGKLLHCLQNSGVILSSRANLQTAGWSNIRYYEHIENKK